MLSDLSDLLNREFDLCRGLLGLLQRERQVVVDCAVEELIQINKEKENLVLKVRILEQSREAILEKLAHRLDLPPEGLTLSALEQRLQEPFAAQLRVFRSNLSSILQSLREVNEENRVFLQHSVDFVKGSLALIRYLTVSSPIYMASGSVGGNALDGRFVSEKA